MKLTKKQPLFIVTGASCVGKSTLCNELFINEKEYIVMESDLLWNDIYNTPEDDYFEYNRLWLGYVPILHKLQSLLCYVVAEYQNNLKIYRKENCLPIFIILPLSVMMLYW